MVEVYERGTAACKKYHKTAGLAFACARVPHFQEMVYCFSVDGSDYRFLCNGYKNLYGKLENMGLKLKHITNF